MTAALPPPGPTRDDEIAELLGLASVPASEQGRILSRIASGDPDRRAAWYYGDGRRCTSRRRPWTACAVRPLRQPLGCPTTGRPSDHQPSTMELASVCTTRWASVVG